MMNTAFVASKDRWKQIAVFNIFNHAVHQLELMVVIAVTVAEIRPCFVTVTCHLDCISREDTSYLQKFSF